MQVNMPFIRSNLFILRDICPADYLDYFEVGKDFETTKYLTWGPLTKPIEAMWLIENINMIRPIEGLPIGYAIVDPRTNKMIGTIDFHTYYSGQNAAEIGFCLHKNYWNRGIISKALRQMIIVGFEHLKLDKIIVGHVRENIGCRNVVLKNDFRYERVVINGFKDKESDTYKDIIYYSIYRYEYERGILKWQ